MTAQSGLDTRKLASHTPRVNGRREGLAVSAAPVRGGCPINSRRPIFLVDGPDRESGAIHRSARQHQDCVTGQPLHSTSPSQYDPCWLTVVGRLALSVTEESASDRVMSSSEKRRGGRRSGLVNAVCAKQPGRAEWECLRKAER